MGGVMKLGDLTWRVDPNSVDWNFQMDTSVINTLGGQVVQILGATLSDLVITGDLGQDHAKNRLSWQLAAAFHQKIKSFMDQQTLPAKTVPTGNVARRVITEAERIATARRTGILSDAGATHAPLPLTYHDGVHDWSFKVLVRSLEDSDGGSLNITNGRFNYRYKLTLFIVEADSRRIKKIASDYFLSRLSDGLGWSRTRYQGPLKAQDAQDFITINGGSVAAFLTKVISGEPLQNPQEASSPRPGGGSGSRKARAN